MVNGRTELAVTDEIDRARIRAAVGELLAAIG